MLLLRRRNAGNQVLSGRGMPTAAAAASYSRGLAKPLIHDTSWKVVHLAG